MSRKTGKPAHRPPHEPTQELREIVQALAALGITHDQIVEYMKFRGFGVRSKFALTSHYAAELSSAKTHKVLMVSQGLYKKAVGAPAEFDEANNKIREEIKAEVTAQIFWLKAQAKWQEPSRFSGSDDGADKGMSLEELIHMSYQAGKQAKPNGSGGAT